MIKKYLGDGCYGEISELGIVLTTSDGGALPTNRIVLEPEVWGALVQLVANARVAPTGSADK